MTMLIYRRHAVQSLITLAKPPKLGCPISNTTSSDSQSVPKKHKSNYSVNKSIHLENLECHWVIYVSERGRYEVCSQNKVESRSHSKCSTCGVFYAAMRKKIASLSIMKFSKLSFKDTMMLGVFNFVEYLQTTALSKPKKMFIFYLFSLCQDFPVPLTVSVGPMPLRNFFGGLYICHVLKNCQ